MKSIEQMINLCRGLVDTVDVNNWENNFLKSVIDTMDKDHCTNGLSGKQVEVVERIYNKHFGD